MPLVRKINVISVMARMPFAIAVVAAICLAACKDGNPVALPTDPGGNADQLVITVTSDRGQVEVGSTTPATLAIRARKSNGQPPTGAIEVTLNTSLGSFGVDSTGNEVKLVTRTLVEGGATVQFFGGSKSGVANILAQVGTNVGSLNLTIVDPPAKPVADYTYVATGLSVLFTDASVGATSYRWQFGDGSESTERSPLHVYAQAGSYVVTLTASNSGGESAKSQFVNVTLGDPPQAAFTFTVNGNQVNFVDKSVGATSWLWVFGDGMSSGQRNPIHVYASAGTYTVALTASNAAGSNTVSDAVTISAGPAPVAKFAFTVEGLRVNFIDQSTGPPDTWMWDFGDGGRSFARDPVHTYAAAGNYTVVLTVSNAAGQSVSSQVVPIEPGTPPEAAFAFEVSGKQVNFIDRSKGSPTSWFWNFGDGTNSSQQNPVHIYSLAGQYTVTLTATNGGGSNTASDVVTIAAGVAPVAAFDATTTADSLQVNFVDRSTGAPTSWSWNFGDGNTSTQRNPVHTYSDPGTYTVTLTVSNANGSNSIAKAVTVPPPPPPP
jgi:PKD repeat protein